MPKSLCKDFERVDWRLNKAHDLWVCKIQVRYWSVCLLTTLMYKRNTTIALLYTGFQSMRELLPHCFSLCVLEEAEQLTTKGWERGMVVLPSSSYETLSILFQVYTAYYQNYPRTQYVLLPVWKTSSFPPTPAASRLIKALIDLAHSCCVMKPWLALVRNKENTGHTILFHTSLRVIFHHVWLQIKLWQGIQIILNTNRTEDQSLPIKLIWTIALI